MWQAACVPVDEGEVAQSCLTLCDPMDCSPPGSSIHGIPQARILEWVAISFSRGSSRPRDRTQVSRIGGRRFNLWATREAPWVFNLPLIKSPSLLVIYAMISATLLLFFHHKFKRIAWTKLILLFFLPSWIKTPQVSTVKFSSNLFIQFKKVVMHIFPTLHHSPM